MRRKAKEKAGPFPLWALILVCGSAKVKVENGIQIRLLPLHLSTRSMMARMGRKISFVVRPCVFPTHSILFFRQTYTCDVFFAQSWKDNRLRLPDNMTTEYRLLPIEWLTEIWRPDSFFKNAKSVTFQRMTIPNHYIWLWKDKTILYMVK